MQHGSPAASELWQWSTARCAGGGTLGAAAAAASARRLNPAPDILRST